MRSRGVSLITEAQTHHDVTEALAQAQRERERQRQKKAVEARRHTLLALGRSRVFDGGEPDSQLGALCEGEESSSSGSSSAEDENESGGEVELGPAAVASFVPRNWLSKATKGKFGEGRTRAAVRRHFMKAVAISALKSGGAKRSAAVAGGGVVDAPLSPIGSGERPNPRKLAGLLHEEWRRGRAGRPLMRVVDGREYDTANLAFGDLPASLMGLNARAATAACHTVEQGYAEGRDVANASFLERAAEEQHVVWLDYVRSRGSLSQRGEKATRPYAQLSEWHKEKSRSNVRLALGLYQSYFARLRELAGLAAAGLTQGEFAAEVIQHGRFMQTTGGSIPTDAGTRGRERLSAATLRQLVAATSADGQLLDSSSVSATTRASTSTELIRGRSRRGEGGEEKPTSGLQDWTRVHGQNGQIEGNAKTAAASAAPGDSKCGGNEEEEEEQAETEEHRPLEMRTMKSPKRIHKNLHDAHHEEAATAAAAHHAAIGAPSPLHRPPSTRRKAMVHRGMSLSHSASGVPDVERLLRTRGGGAQCVPDLTTPGTSSAGASEQRRERVRRLSMTSHILKEQHALGRARRKVDEAYTAHASAMSRRIEARKKAIAKTKARFAELDVDGDGAIELEELKRGLAGVEEETVEAIFRAYDKDGDGQLSLSEIAPLIKELDEYMEHFSHGAEFGYPITIQDAAVVALRSRMDRIKHNTKLKEDLHTGDPPLSTMAASADAAVAAPAPAPAPAAAVESDVSLVSSSVTAATATVIKAAALATALAEKDAELQSALAKTVKSHKAALSKLEKEKDDALAAQKAKHTMAAEKVKTEALLAAKDAWKKEMDLANKEHRAKITALERRAAAAEKKAKAQSVSAAAAAAGKKKKTKKKLSKQEAAAERRAAAMSKGKKSKAGGSAATRPVSAAAKKEAARERRANAIKAAREKASEGGGATAKSGTTIPRKPKRAAAVAVAAASGTTLTAIMQTTKAAAAAEVQTQALLSAAKDAWKKEMAVTNAEHSVKIKALERRAEAAEEIAQSVGAAAAAAAVAVAGQKKTKKKLSKQEAAAERRAAAMSSKAKKSKSGKKSPKHAAAKDAAFRKAAAETAAAESKRLLEEQSIAHGAALVALRATHTAERAAERAAGCAAGRAAALVEVEELRTQHAARLVEMEARSKLQVASMADERAAMASTVSRMRDEHAAALTRAAQRLERDEHEFASAKEAAKGHMETMCAAHETEADELRAQSAAALAMSRRANAAERKLAGAAAAHSANAGGAIDAECVLLRKQIDMLSNALQVSNATVEALRARQSVYDARARSPLRKSPAAAHVHIDRNGNITATAAVEAAAPPTAAAAASDALPHRTMPGRQQPSARRGLWGTPPAPKSAQRVMVEEHEAALIAAAEGVAAGGNRSDAATPSAAVAWRSRNGLDHLDQDLYSHGTRPMTPPLPAPLHAPLPAPSSALYGLGRFDGALSAIGSVPIASADDDAPALTSLQVAEMVARAHLSMRRAGRLLSARASAN